MAIERSTSDSFLLRVGACRANVCRCPTCPQVSRRQVSYPPPAGWARTLCAGTRQPGPMSTPTTANATSRAQGRAAYAATEAESPDGASRPSVVDSSDGALAAVLSVAPPGAALCRVTAARRYGLTLPEGLIVDPQVHVLVPSGRRFRRRGVTDWRGVEQRRIHDVNGLRMTSLGDTWCDLASHLSETDLVIMGDEIANRAGVEELQCAVSARRHGRYVRVARRALARVRRGSASPMETRARLGFVEGGLPEPELNAVLYDEAGEWFAQVDFLWREARLIVEYQSEYHGDPRRREADETRRRQLEAAGYRVVFITASTILRPVARDELCRQLIAAGRAAGCAW